MALILIHWRLSLFPSIAIISVFFFHLGCTKRSYDQPYRGGSRTSGTIGAAPKVFTVSSLMAKHREKKSIKEMGPNHHSQLLRFPSVPLGREPSFFFRIKWQWYFWWVPAVSTLHPSSPLSLTFRVNWVIVQQVAWLPSVCFRFSKNLSGASFLYLSYGFWQDSLFPVRPQALVFKAQTLQEPPTISVTKTHTHTAFSNNVIN